jgi:uncharacterized membrane protein YdjX (TVP38/TMEM64 family)
MPKRSKQPVSVSLKNDFRDLLRPAVLFLFALLVAGVALKFHLQDRLPQLKAAIASLGPWGPVAFILINAVAILVALPAVLFSVASGAIFGLGWGSLYAWLGGLLGAALGFMAARYLARSSVRHYVDRHPLARKLDAGAEKYDALLVVATRVLPIFPFVVVNYAWGLTRIRFGPYLAWTAIGKTPNFIFFVALGAASAEGLTNAKIPPDTLWTMGIMAVVMAVVSIWIKRTVGPAGEKAGKKQQSIPTRRSGKRGK